MNVALDPSATEPVGPLMLRSALSTSLGSPVVPLSSSVSVISADLTVKSVTSPDTVIVSLPSTILSSTGVKVSVPVALGWPAGMVMLVSAVVTV